MAELTDEQRAVLDFERQLWRYTGAKESAIRARFGFGLVRFNQVLAYTIAQPEALAYDPVNVRRLRRLRDRRMAERGRVYWRAG